MTGSAHTLTTTTPADAARVTATAVAPRLPPTLDAAPSDLAAHPGGRMTEAFVPQPGLRAVLGAAWGEKGVNGGKRKARAWDSEGPEGPEGRCASEEGEEGGAGSDDDGADTDTDGHDDAGPTAFLSLSTARRVPLTRPTPPTRATALLPAPIPSKRAKRRRGARAGLLDAERLPPIPLPPLPPILDPALEARVFTHSSWIDGTRPARAAFEAAADAPHYEKLEHVGDAVLGMVVTVWLHETKPGLPCGTATKLKSHLVSNGTLSHLAGLYGLPQRMRADARLAPVLRAQTDVRAALLEAYVAAVLFSFPPHARDVGLAVVTGWLREMYDPLLDFFYAHMCAEHAAHVAAVGAVDGVVHAATDARELERVDAMSEGMALLVGAYARSRGRDASYDVQRAQTNVGALWTVKCLVDGVEMGEATRALKHRARNAAAWEAAVRLGLTGDTTF